MIFLGLSLGSMLPHALAEALNMEELLPKDDAAAPAEDATAPEPADATTEAAPRSPTPAPPAVVAPAPAAMPEMAPAPPATRGDVLTLPTPPTSVSLTLPGRGMKKTEVEAKFGAPVEKVEAVGTPPISRWIYKDFTVYFESDTVLHAVLKEP